MTTEQKIYITPVSAVEEIAKQKLTGILIYENGNKGQIHFNLGKITAIDDEEKYEDFISFLYNCDKVKFSDLKKQRPLQAASFESDKIILASKIGLERIVINRGYNFYWQLMLMFMLKSDNGQCRLLPEDVHIDNEIVSSVKIDSFIACFDSCSKLLEKEYSLSRFACKIISPKIQTEDLSDRKTILNSFIYNTKKDLPEFLSAVEKACSLKSLSIITEKKPLSYFLKLVFGILMALFVFFIISH